MRYSQIVLILVLATVAMVVFQIPKLQKAQERVKFDYFTAFMQQLEAGEVAEYTLRPDSIVGKLTDGREFSVRPPPDPALWEKLEQRAPDVPVGVEARSRADAWFGVIGKVLLPLLLICVLCMWLYQAASRQQAERSVQIGDFSEVVRAIAQRRVMPGTIRVHGMLPSGQRFSVAAPSDRDLWQGLLDEDPEGGVEGKDGPEEPGE